MGKELNHIDKLVNSKLQTHAVDSTVNSWAVISRKLAWRNFLYFRFNSINIYYTSAVIIITLWGSLNYFNTNANSLPDNYSLANDSYNNTIQTNPSNIDNIDNTNSNNTYKLNPTNPNNIDKTNTSEIIKVEPVTTDINTNITSRGNQQDIATNVTLKVNSDIVKVNNQKSSNEIKHTSKVEINNPAFALNNELSKKISSLSLKENSSQKDVTAIFNSELFKSSNQSSDILKYSNINSISPIFLDNMSLFSEQNMDPQFRRDDTLEFYKLPSERTAWFIEGYFSPLYTSNITESINSEMTQLIDIKSEIENPVLSFTTGVNILYQGKHNIILQTGIAYTELGERIKREDTEQINNYSALLYPDGGYPWTDTILFVNIDSLNQGIHYVDTLFETNWIDDNTMVDVSDTTKYKGTNTRNKYSYIEIPLIAGYNIQGSGFDLQLKAGLITGFWINSTGIKANPENSLDLVDMNSGSPKFRKINYSVTAGFNINYPLSEKINLTTGLMYRKNLFDIYDSYLYTQKQFGTEVHIGIQYRL